MSLAEATIRLSINATEMKVLDLATPEARTAITEALTLAAGTGLDQADRIFHDRRTLSASATENLDLAGVLTDIFGDALSFARIKLIYVKAAAANTNNVLVGGAASNAFPFLGDATDIVPLKPGEWFVKVTGSATAWPVTAGTGDILKV